MSFVSSPSEARVRRNHDEVRGVVGPLSVGIAAVCFAAVTLAVIGWGSYEAGMAAYRVGAEAYEIGEGFVYLIEAAMESDPYGEAKNKLLLLGAMFLGSIWGMYKLKKTFSPRASVEPTTRKQQSRLPSRTIDHTPEQDEGGDHIFW